MTSTTPTQRSDEQLAKRLKCSAEAILLCRSSEVIDLHLDTLIPYRLWGYHPLQRHRNWLLGRHFFSHTDLPRLQEGGLSGAMWSITTNPFRRARSRWKYFLRNLQNLQHMCQQSKGKMQIVRHFAEYQAARRNNIHACIPSIQGGNALEAAPSGALSIPDHAIVRITLLHLTNACYGTSSVPLHFHRKNKGLTKQGKAFVEQLNQARIFVDLAHIHPQGFWDAVAIHDREQPLLDTHTGVNGIRSHWRNLDDRQLKAIADTGGVVGIIFAANYLQRWRGPSNAEMIVEHLEHAMKIIGEDHLAIGSDFDGAISPPSDLSAGDAYPVLVQKMLDRKWSETTIQKILGNNFLRCFEQLRPNEQSLNFSA